MTCFSPYLKDFQTWLGTASDAELYASPRTYCEFGATQLDWRYYRDELFDRSSANKIFVKNYNISGPQGKLPGVMAQRDIDAVYSLQRSFVARHKTRLQYYRDDLANKGVRVPMSIAVTEAAADALASKIGDVDANLNQ